MMLVLAFVFLVEAPISSVDAQRSGMFWLGEGVARGSRDPTLLSYTTGLMVATKVAARYLIEWWRGSSKLIPLSMRPGCVRVI